MTHTTEGMLQAYLDGELRLEDRAGVERHLAACATCAGELESLRALVAEFTRVVGVLDLASPAPVEFAPPALRATRASQAPRVSRARAGASWRPAAALFSGAPAALLRAAVVVLLLGGVAWGALPGSTLREWVGQLWSGGAAATAGAAGAGPAEGAGATSSAAQFTSGISVLPVSGEARVLVQDPAVARRLLVRPVAGPQVMVQWTGSGADPHFRTAPGRIEVLSGDAGELLIEAPRGSRTLIEVAGRLIAIVEGGLVQPLIAGDRDGDEVVFSALSRGH